MASRRIAAHLLTPTGAMKAWPATLMMGLGIGIALLMMFVWVAKVDRDNERRDIQRSREICGLIKITDDLTQKQPAPTGPNAEGIATYRQEIHRYRQRLGCDEK